KQELRADEHSLQRRLDARFKPARAAPRFEEAHQTLKVCVREWLSIGTSGQGGDNPSPAGQFRAAVGRPACADPAPAGRISRAGAVERTIDGQRLNVRLS